MPDYLHHEAPIHRVAPIWRALGYQHTKHGKRYWLTIGTRTRAYRAGEMYGLSFLVDVYPDPEHWRRIFPYGEGRRINTGAALAYFIKQCEDAGEYVPPGNETGAF